MHHTWKGIYMKFSGCNEETGGLTSNILYENIYMDKPEQFSIWIGPAQQSDGEQSFKRQKTDHSLTYKTI